MKLADSDDEFKKLTENKEVEIIRSMDDWKKFLKNNEPESEESVFQGLSQENIEKFTENLVFLNGGLAGAKFGPIKSLSEEKFFELWAKFGISKTYYENHEGNECAGEGKFKQRCRRASDSLCTSNCYNPGIFRKIRNFF